jgi:hypothetical protein
VTLKLGSLVACRRRQSPDRVLMEKRAPPAFSDSSWGQKGERAGGVRSGPQPRVALLGSPRMRAISADPSRAIYPAAKSRLAPGLARPLAIRRPNLPPGRPGNAPGFSTAEIRLRGLRRVGGSRLQRPAPPPRRQASEAKAQQPGAQRPLPAFLDPRTSSTGSDSLLDFLRPEATESSLIRDDGGVARDGSPSLPRTSGAFNHDTGAGSPPPHRRLGGMGG